MDLYFSPLACSLATRIALYEAGAHAEYIAVDPKTKRTQDGADFCGVNPLGLVPTLRTDGGEVLTENAAILQYVAGAYPEAKLAPEGRLERARLQQWLCYIGTELHKALFVPLLDKTASPEVKAYALAKADSRLGLLERHLTGRGFLLEEFSVADAYLFAVLNWALVTPVDLRRWPAIAAYRARVGERPGVKRAFEDERGMYMREQATATAARAV